MYSALPQRELKRQMTLLERGPSTVVLDYNEETYSKKPIYSEGFFNCNSVILFSGQFAAVSHHDLGSKKSEVYIPEMIKTLVSQSGSTDISSVLVGGDSTHLQKNKALLTDYKIPVVAEYCDSWMDIATLNEGKTLVGKHLFVIPQTREVILHSYLEDYKPLIR